MAKKKNKEYHLDTENLDVDFVRVDGNSTLDIDTKLIDIHSEKIDGKRKTKISIDKEALQTVTKLTSKDTKSKVIRVLTNAVRTIFSSSK
jgi:hypothetical protein